MYTYVCMCVYTYVYVCTFVYIHSLSIYSSLSIHNIYIYIYMATVHLLLWLRSIDSSLSIYSSLSLSVAILAQVVNIHCPGTLPHLWGWCSGVVGVGGWANLPPLAQSSPTSGWPASLVAPSSLTMASGSGGPAKRGRDAGDDCDLGDDFVKKFDLEPLLSDFKNKSLGEDVRSSVEQLTGGKMEDLFRYYDSGIQKRLAGHDAEIADLNKHIAAIESDHDKFKTDLAQTRAALALTQSTAAQVVRTFQEEDFDKQPDLTLIRFNTSELVARSAVLDSIKPWLSDAGLQDDQWEMIGDPSGIFRFFPIRFAGPGGLAARRARKCLQVRRQPDGTWRPNPVVVSPMGRRVGKSTSPVTNPRSSFALSKGGGSF